MDWGAFDANAGSAPLGPACAPWQRNTCCGKKQVDAVWRFVVALEKGDATRECRAWTERVKCAALCDPDVGVGRRPALVCKPECELWYAACRDAFLAAPAGAGGSWLPCHDGALLCSRAADAFADASSFCDAMGVKMSEAENCLSGEAPPIESRGRRVASAPTSSDSDSAREAFSEAWAQLVRRVLPGPLARMVLDPEYAFASWSSFVGGVNDAPPLDLMEVLGSNVALAVSLAFLALAVGRRLGRGAAMRFARDDFQ